MELLKDTLCLSEAARIAHSYFFSRAGLTSKDWLML